MLIYTLQKKSKQNNSAFTMRMMVQGKKMCTSQKCLHHSGGARHQTCSETEFSEQVHFMKKRFYFPSLILAARACAAKPSASPRMPENSALALAPSLPEIARSVVTVLRNIRTESPPVKRALPLVGSVWFSPAA